MTNRIKVHYLWSVCVCVYEKFSPVTYMQDEVSKLIDTTLGEREREIIRLYYGLDNECLTWEDISKR